MAVAQPKSRASRLAIDPDAAVKIDTQFQTAVADIRRRPAGDHCPLSASSAQPTRPHSSGVAVKVVEIYETTERMIDSALIAGTLPEPSASNYMPRPGSAALSESGGRDWPK